MYKARILLALGTWMAILPYLGFPYSWKDTLTLITGLIIIYISYLFYKDYKIRENKEKIFDNFSENNDFSEEKNKANIIDSEMINQELPGHGASEYSSEE